ncbi:MAG: hypothetical protein WBA23_10550, partial [Tunicatimonas sp.]|uniref:hypothetical protein n=1 Tax=Tunicatimonas sp. TaxID=1940096 RepID=UPI003C7548C3
MNPDTLNKFRDTFQVSKSLIEENRKLTKKAINNTLKGEQKTKNVAISVNQLNRSRQNLVSTINAYFRVQQNSPLENYDPKDLATHMLLHDVRGPIVNIVSLVQLIKRDSNLSEELSQLIDLVEKQAEKVHDRTQSHAVYHQLELGAYQPQEEPVDLLQIFCKIQSNIQRKQFANPIEIWIDGQPATAIQHCTIQGDSLLMELLLQNLVQNAVEASLGSAPVRVDISSNLPVQQVGQKQLEDIPTTSISIHNQGVIPVVMQDQFFEKYATYGKTKGTGLG